MSATARVKPLTELITGIPCSVVPPISLRGRPGNTNIEIAGIAYHSAQVKPGYLFVAIDGMRVSGQDFIDEAINRGAIAVATSDVRRINKNWVVAIQTSSPRRFLAQVANRFYDFPSRKLSLIGVTGTNGKTTTCYLLRSVCRQLGFEPGFIGTIEYWDGVEKKSAENTTPESLDLVQMLSQMVERGIKLCISEVSSHALELDRVFDLDFRVGVFTNLTQDHLDFHRTMDNYRRAKMRLFESLTPNSWAVVNFDDRVGVDIPNLTRAKVLGYGTQKEPDLVIKSEHNIVGYIWGEVIDVNPNGLKCVIHTDALKSKKQNIAVRLRLAGRHNLLNLLAVFGVGEAMGWDQEAIVRGVEELESVPGRMERIENDHGLYIYVDYAHTPDALSRVLQTARELTKGRVIVIFGCGGDRDRTKRPLMGRVAIQNADVVVITSDNPRGEDPAVIIEEILSGIDKEVRTASEHCWVEIDRREGIRRAITFAHRGDTIIIAGKGHEDYQLIGEERRHFDDREVVRQILQEFNQ